MAACVVCHRFAANNKFVIPGYIHDHNDIFKPWSIDFAGLFSGDRENHTKYVVLGIDFLSRWAEAEPVVSADA